MPYLFIISILPTRPMDITPTRLIQSWEEYAPADQRDRLMADELVMREPDPVRPWILDDDREIPIGQNYEFAPIDQRNVNIMTTWGMWIAAGDSCDTSPEDEQEGFDLAFANRTADEREEIMNQWEAAEMYSFMVQCKTDYRDLGIALACAVASLCGGYIIHDDNLGALPYGAYRVEEYRQAMLP